MADQLKYIKGVGDLSAALKQIPRDMQQSVLAQAVKLAIEPILAAAKMFALRSQRTGALRASLTTKVVRYPRRNVVVGLVGPSRDYYRGKEKATGRVGKLWATRPAWYAHLVELGHVSVKPRKGTTIRKPKRGPHAPAVRVGWVKPKPFLMPAILASRSQQEERFFVGIRTGYMASVRRQIRAGTHVKS